MSAISFNASDSIHVLYGIHTGVSPAYLRRRIVDVGLPCYHANDYPPDEMNQYFEQGAMSWTLYDHDHPLSTCFTFQNSARIWEIGGVYIDPAHRRKGYAAIQVTINFCCQKRQKLLQGFLTLNGDDNINYFTEWLCFVMEIVATNIRKAVLSYLEMPEIQPLFLNGDARSVLKEFPDTSIDMAMTSPPYWQKRQYANGGIGLEREYTEYIANLCSIVKELYRVLKDTGSFWLNIGDSYKNKRLLGIPWRVVFEMTDQQGWILRNNVIWNKVKGGPDNSKDKLRNIHENIFHFVKQPSGYYYNVDAMRTKPREAKVVNGAVVSATGVSGVRYKRQIELSTELTEHEKTQAMQALEEMLQKVKAGETSDFRMIIRGKQRTTHSNSEKLSADPNFLC